MKIVAKMTLATIPFASKGAVRIPQGAKTRLIQSAKYLRIPHTLFVITLVRFGKPFGILR